jgi:sulfonate transport system substrate-binding protein
MIQHRFHSPTLSYRIPRMLNRRTFALTGLSAALAPSARANTVLRIGDQKGGIKSLMTAAGTLAGIDNRIEWYIFAAAAPLLEALNAGAIDCGGVGDAPFAFARAAGLRAKIVAATRSDGASTALLVRNNTPYRTFADLKGRTIGTGKGSVGHFLAIAARDQAGLAPTDITFAFLSPADAQTAFAAGAIDVWSTWGQYVYLALAQSDARILLDGKGLMSGLSYTVATDQAIAAKHDTLRLYLQRMNTALRWGLRNTDRYATAWAAETGVPHEVARQTLLAQRFAPAPINRPMVADQQHTVDLYANEHVLPTRYDTASAFDPQSNAPQRLNQIDSRG